jgi:hypothetical protein
MPLLYASCTVGASWCTHVLLSSNYTRSIYHNNLKQRSYNVPLKAILTQNVLYCNADYCSQIGALTLRPPTLRPLVTTTQMFHPQNVTIQNLLATWHGPRFHVHPCFDLDVLSHVTLCPTWTNWLVTLRPSFYQVNLGRNVTSTLDIPGGMYVRCALSKKDPGSVGHVP